MIIWKISDPRKKYSEVFKYPKRCSSDDIPTDIKKENSTTVNTLSKPPPWKQKAYSTPSLVIRKKVLSNNEGRKGHQAHTAKRLNHASWTKVLCVVPKRHWREANHNNFFFFSGLSAWMTWHWRSGKWCSIVKKIMWVICAVCSVV